MNTFFHAFAPGFNWWYVVAPFGLLVMILVGTRQYKIVGDRVRQVFNKNLFCMIAVVFVLIFMVMVYAESSFGIIQSFDNNLLPGESPIWSVIMMPMAIIAMGMFYGAILYAAGTIAGWAKCGQLHEQLRERAYQKKHTANNAGRLVY